MLLDRTLYRLVAWTGQGSFGTEALIHPIRLSPALWHTIPLSVDPQPVNGTSYSRFIGIGPEISVVMAQHRAGALR